jgi:hypothetical protein
MKYTRYKDVGVINDKRRVRGLPSRGLIKTMDWKRKGKERKKIVQNKKKGEGIKSKSRLNSSFQHIPYRQIATAPTEAWRSL